MAWNEALVETIKHDTPKRSHDAHVKGKFRKSLCFSTRETKQDEIISATFLAVGECLVGFW